VARRGKGLRMITASPEVGTAQRARQAPGARVAILPDIDAMRERQAQWFALWRNVPDATPFQSPPWLLCWAEHYARGRSGAVVVEDGDELLAMLPYFLWQETLWLAGTGTSDYGDVLVAPRAARLVDVLLDALVVVAQENGCGRVDLRQLRPESALLAAPAPRGWRSETTPGEPCMSMPLHGEAGLGAVSKRWRRNAAYARRALGRTGTWVLQRVPADESSHAADVLLCLHERRWSARGEPQGVFADRLLRGFVHEVIPRLGGAGLLRMHALKLDHRPLAATFAMHAPGATHIYLTGFDPAASRHSPGLLSIMAAIGTAAAEGDHTVHFLRGRERYKGHLGAIECTTWRRLLRRGASH